MPAERRSTAERGPPCDGDAHEVVAGRDRYTRDLGVGHGGAAERLDGRGPAQALLHRSRQERGIGGQDGALSVDTHSAYDTASGAWTSLPPLPEAKDHLIGAVVVTALLGLAFAPVAGRLRGIYLGVASLALVFLGLYFGQSAEELTGGTSTGRTPTPFSLFGFPFTNDGPEITLLGVPIRQAERMWYLFLLLTVLAFVIARGAVAGRSGRSGRATARRPSRGLRHRSSLSHD